jgi:hypothetical protein
MFFKLALISISNIIEVNYNIDTIIFIIKKKLFIFAYIIIKHYIINNITRQKNIIIKNK